MNPISSEIVEKTWKEIGGQSPETAPEMIKHMTKKQPVILAHLMASGHDILNRDERELLLYLGIVIWQIMLQGDTPLPKVTEKTLEDIDKSNMKMLEYLEGESDTGFIETTEQLFKDYLQPEVLKYVIEAIMEEPHEDCQIRDEYKGIMVIYLKTIIDCFNK